MTQLAGHGRCRGAAHIGYRTDRLAHLRKDRGPCFRGLPHSACQASSRVCPANAQPSWVPKTPADPSAPASWTSSPLPRCWRCWNARRSTRSKRCFDPDLTHARGALPAGAPAADRRRRGDPRDSEPGQRPGSATHLCGAARRQPGSGRRRGPPDAGRRRTRDFGGAGLTSPTWRCPRAAGAKSGKTAAAAASPQRLVRISAQDRAVVGRDGQVAVGERAGGQRRPLADHLTTVDPAAEREHRLPEPVVGAAAAVLGGPAPELRERDDVDLVDSAGPRSVAKAARQAATSASCRCSQSCGVAGLADIGVHVPVVVVQAGDLQADIALDQPGQVLAAPCRDRSSDR